MYKLYRVIRTDKVDWDEYSECVVIASDTEEAFSIAHSNYIWSFKREHVNIIEIKLDSAKAVLGLLNAG